MLRAGSITNSKNLSRNAEIIQAVDLALEAYRRQGKLEAFAPALEAMAVKHQLLMATTRINAIDPHSPLQRQLKQDLEQKFPAWRENPWLSRFPAQHRLLLQLIDRGRYGAVHALMAANKILKGRTG